MKWKENEAIQIKYTLAGHFINIFTILYNPIQQLRYEFYF